LGSIVKEKFFDGYFKPFLLEGFKEVLYRLNNEVEVGESDK